jgi:lantibiotic modifying enzyme
MNPLLEGDAAATARAVVDTIADELASPVADPSLAGGSAGIALFWAFLGRVAAAEGKRVQAERAGELAEEALDAALDHVASVPMDAGLFSGFTGVAWAVELLRGQDEGEGEDSCEEVDTAPPRLA